GLGPEGHDAQAGDRHQAVRGAQGTGERRALPRGLEEDASAQAMKKKSKHKAEADTPRARRRRARMVIAVNIEQFLGDPIYTRRGNIDHPAIHVADLLLAALWAEGLKIVSIDD